MRWTSLLDLDLHIELGFYPRFTPVLTAKSKSEVKPIAYTVIREDLLERENSKD